MGGEQAENERGRQRTTSLNKNRARGRFLYKKPFDHALKLVKLCDVLFVHLDEFYDESSHFSKNPIFCILHYFTAKIWGKAKSLGYFCF